MKTINTISIGLIGMMFSVASMQAAEPPASAAPKTEWQNITAELVKATGLDQRKVEGKDSSGNPRLGAVYMTRFQGMLVLPNGEVLVTSNDKGTWHSTDQGATWAKYGEPWMKGVAQSSLSLKMYYPDRIGLTLDGPGKAGKRIRVTSEWRLVKASIFCGIWSRIYCWHSSGFDVGFP